MRAAMKALLLFALLAVGATAADFAAFKNVGTPPDVLGAYCEEGPYCWVTVRLPWAGRAVGTTGPCHDMSFNK